MIRRARNRLWTLLMFYRRHLRIQPLRELMAVAGVAAGVALLFAVQINNRSITGSFDQIVHGVAGHATLEVAAREPQGFDQSIYDEVARMPGVKAAAPLFEQPIVAMGPRGSRSLLLVGATEELASLGGNLAAQTLHTAESGVRRGLLVLTEPSARAIGVKAGRVVPIKVGARTERLALDATVPSARIGALAESPVAAAPLPVVQALAGLPARVTRVLIEPRLGTGASLKRALTQRFGRRQNVRSVDTEPRLLANAAAPESELTALFSAISLVVGVILAYNALLLASTERRRFIVYLVELGTPDSMIVASLAFDAIILGLAGTVLGLLLGDLISVLAYRAAPGYLTAAFPIGRQRVVGWQTIFIAVGAGMIAAFAAATLPAMGLLRSGAEAEPEAVGHALSSARRLRLRDSVAFAAGMTLIFAAVAVSLLRPASSLPALIGLAAGIVLALPLMTRYLVTLARAAARHSNDPSARLATGQLQNSPTLPIALLATGTITVFLMVMIGGSIADVQRAVRIGAAQTGASADLWVRPGGPENIYATQPFAFGDTQRRLEHQGVVRQVLPWRGSFLDLSSRRVWVIAIPPQARESIAPSQLVSGSLNAAEQHLREGGWVLVSQAIASERHLRPGDLFSLPTPSGAASFRLAGTIANYGWVSGTVIMNGSEYSRLWGSPWATQLAVTLAPGVSASEGKRAVEQALPSGSALGVLTDAEREAQVTTVLGSTLSRLSATTVIVLFAAIASVVAMMVAAVWQRRGRLDALMSIGMSFGQFARLIFYESGSVLLGGCLLGMASGILGQYLAENSLHQTTGGSTVPFAPAWQLGLIAIGIAGGISVLAATIAVLRTVGFQPRTAFSTE